VQKALLDETRTQGIAVNFDMKLTDLAEDATGFLLTFASYLICVCVCVCVRERERWI
jgi:hypothetical protein